LLRWSDMNSTSDLPFDTLTSVREILARWPSTRGVFERTGLLGCGGPEGPAEPLGLFAELHHVPLDSLQRSLHAAIRAASVRSRRELTVAPAVPLAFEPVHRYKPFLLTALALTLTFGATLGMINLARMTTPWFGGMTMSSVRAHAFVQVFGFVGLFVMGVACHVLPRFAAQALGLPRFVRPMFWFQVTGIVAIVAAFMLRDDVLRAAWIVGSLALVAAGSMFTVVVKRTLAGLQPPERFARWVIAGALWQVATALASLAAAWLNDVAILQALWPAALWGFAGSWILGIGRRIFPGFLGWRPRAPRAEGAAFVIYQAAVALSAAAAWPLEGVGASVVAPLAIAGAAGLLVSVPLYSYCIGAGSMPKTRHDSDAGYQQYIAAAWLWLHVALAVGPLWTVIAVLRDAGVPPLVTDFARHALAFGFVAQVMMGVAARVLPVFTGNALWSPRARSAAFYLLNLSVLLRGLEAVIAAGLVPAAWPFVAIAGPPALAAVVLFAFNVVFTIYGRPVAHESARSLALADRRIAEIITIPGALDVLVDAGFTPLRNPAMRMALAGSVSLRQACGLKGIRLEPLLARIAALHQSELITR
jgi:uncharacterized protein involved in response to NO